MEGISDLYKSYEQEFTGHLMTINDQLTSVIPKATGEHRRKALSETERTLDTADELLGQLELEIHTLTPDIRAKLHQRIRNYQSELSRLKTEHRVLAFSRGTVAMQNDRRALLDGPDPSQEWTVTSQDQRTHLVQATERLENAGSALDDIHRLAIVTRNVGEDTLHTLGRQGEQLHRSRETQERIAQGASQARVLLRDIRRSLCEHWVLIGLIVMVALVGGSLLLYLRFTR